MRFTFETTNCITLYIVVVIIKYSIFLNTFFSVHVVFILIPFFHVFFYSLSLLLGHVGGCGITDEVSQWMENIQNSAVEELPTPMSKDERIPKKRAPTEDKILLAAEEYNAAKKKSSNSSSNSNSNSNSNSQQEKTTSSSVPPPLPPKKYANNYQNNGAMDDFKYPFEKYTREANFRDVIADDADDDDATIADDDDEVAAATAGAGYFYDPETGRRLQPTDRDWHERVHERVRRASGSSGSSARREDNKNTCSLYIQTDPLIWRHIREGIADVSITTKTLRTENVFSFFLFSVLQFFSVLAIT